MKCAIQKFQNSLLQEDKHNEIIGYLPKVKAVIAKSPSLEFLPQELLDFAQNEDLPVVLI